MAKTQALVSWEKALADAAVKAAGKEASAASIGQFFSIKGGQLSWGGIPVPGNQMGVIILASTIERVYYQGVYDPQTPVPPACYAFGDDLALLAPFEQAESKQNKTCSTCPQNEWGTSSRGKGKACRELRRLSVISAGSYDGSKFSLIEDAETLRTVSGGLLRVPTTSIRAYSGWVMQVADVSQRPPWGVVCRIKVLPDAAAQVRVTFETQADLPTALLEPVFSRVAAAEKSLVFPYPKGSDKPAPVRAAQGRRKF